MEEFAFYQNVSFILISKEPIFAEEVCLFCHFE